MYMELDNPDRDYMGAWSGDESTVLKCHIS